MLKRLFLGYEDHQYSLSLDNFGSIAATNLYARDHQFETLEMTAKEERADRR